MPWVVIGVHSESDDEWQEAGPFDTKEQAEEHIKTLDLPDGGLGFFSPVELVNGRPASKNYHVQANRELFDEFMRLGNELMRFRYLVGNTQVITQADLRTWKADLFKVKLKIDELCARGVQHVIKNKTFEPAQADRWVR